jgi:hypothetical protein
MRVSEPDEQPQIRKSIPPFQLIASGSAGWAFWHWKWHLDEVYVKINGKIHRSWPENAPILR